MPHVSNTPLVSVVMPVLNAERYLEEAVTSILDQSFRDFEFVVVDDGSTDGSAAILDRHARADARLRVISGRHEGLVRALNSGCRAARGTYIARMDADDVALPGRLARQVDLLESEPEVAVVGGQVEMLMPGGRCISTTDFPLSPVKVAEALESRNVICHPAATMRTAAYMQAGGYREPFPYAEDFDLWLRIAEHHELANLSDVVLRYRCHAEQASIVHVEQQMFSTLGGLTASRIRKSTGQDPIRTSRPLTKPDLLEMGVEEQAIERTITNRCLTLASGAIGDGQFAPAEVLLQRVLRGVGTLKAMSEAACLAR